MEVVADPSQELHVATLIHQVDAGRTEAVAGLVTKAMYPFDWERLGYHRWVTDGTARGKIEELSRYVAMCANPAYGWTDIQLRGLLQITFKGYGSYCEYQSYSQMFWICHYMVATKPEKYDIDQLIEELDANMPNPNVASPSLPDRDERNQVGERQQEEESSIRWAMRVTGTDDPFDATTHLLGAMGEFAAVKTAIDGLLAEGLALRAGSVSEPHPPVPSYVRGNYTPEPIGRPASER